MKRNLTYLFRSNIYTVYDAYIRAVATTFKKNAAQENFHTITFGLNFSFKYNMNGGSCCVHFMPYNGGTAVYIRYSIVQAVGARYKAHAEDLNQAVSNILFETPIAFDINVDEFLKPENKVTNLAYPKYGYSYAPSPTPKPAPMSQGTPRFCFSCGAALAEGARFCAQCGCGVR